MKIRIMFVVLMTLALVTSSVAVGHAGGGAGLSVGAVLLDCYLIHNGANSPYTLELVDRFGDHQHVRVGKARLLCTPTSAATVERGPVPNPDFTTLTQDDLTHIKCYDVLGARPKGPSIGIKITDPLATESVTLDQMATLCTPAATDPPLPQ